MWERSEEEEEKAYQYAVRRARLTGRSVRAELNQWKTVNAFVKKMAQRI